MTKCMQFLRKQPLLTAIIGFLFAIGGVKLLDSEGYFALGVHRFLLALAMCPFLYLISGEKSFKSGEKTTGYVFRNLVGILIFGGVLGVVPFITAVFQKRALADGWGIQFILCLFAMLGVGMFEELAFRAVFNDGFVYQFRDKKWVLSVSAVVGSLLFGFVHVMGESVATPQLLAQVVLKTVSTGLWGMALLFLYWKTRNIWACGLLHGIYDFLTKASSAVFISENTTGHTYVREGFTGYVAIGTYVVQTIILIIILLSVRKKVLKSIDFEEMKQNW